MNFLFNLSNRKKLLFFILSILCGFLDYLICDLVAWVNHLPLFCDTIFIMALSFLQALGGECSQAFSIT